MMPAERSAPAHGAVHRVALAVAALIGAFLVAFPLAIGLPGKSAASGDLMSAMRPHMTDTALAQGRADLKTMGSMATQMNGAMLPTLAKQLNMTPLQLRQYLDTSFPAVAAGTQQLPAVMARFGDLQQNMELQQSNFRQADQIPTGFMPPTWMTPLFLLPGAALLLIGVAGLVRPHLARRALAGAGAVGVLMAALLLATTMYGKATSADDMTSAFKPVFTVDAVHTMSADAAQMQAMGTELTQKALPGLAAALHLTPAQLSGTIARDYPAVATGVAAMPAMLQRMQASVDVISNNVDNFNQTAEIPWSPGSMQTVYWFMMGPALLVIATAAGGLLAMGAGRLVLPAGTLRRRTLRHH